MCGRYNFTVEETEELQRILERLDAKFKTGEYKTGEIYPTDKAPILIAEEQAVSPVVAAWGFPQYSGKGVIINARAETAFEKKTFRDSLIYRRCIVLSTGFYEWDKEKRKFLFREPEINTLYMAGLYSLYQGELRYVVLTTAANESMQDVHDRMPLVIPRNDVDTWILSSGATGDFIRRVPDQLVKQIV